MNNTRRNFIKSTGVFACGFGGLKSLIANSSKSQSILGYGNLVKDNEGIMDLPKGFSYKVIGKAGEKMNDGFFLPDKPDGMAAFGNISDEVVVIRNHEINPLAFGSTGPFGFNNRKMNQVPDDLIYDKGRVMPCLGGTTTFVYNTKTQKIVNQFLSLVGTLRNCSGGPTPWNTWITCEEIVLGTKGPCKKEHGWCFEVPVSTKASITKPIPLKDMGRFNHEAVAVDPDSGDVFLTEDRNDGLIYRFVPKQKGNLKVGGKLYALRLKGYSSCDTRNWKSNHFNVGQSEMIDWIELENVQSPKDDLRFRGFEAGAAQFARGEGMWYSDGAIYFACTNGGIKKHGQIWKLKENTLELFSEPNDADLIDNCDNLTVSASGDLFLCEDGKGEQYIDVITKEGKIFKFAKNAKSSSELAGPTFSPDGTTLFVNIQHDGLTLAITGPWDKKLI